VDLHIARLAAIFLDFEYAARFALPLTLCLYRASDALDLARFSGFALHALMYSALVFMEVIV
jgi:hypothetical protein